MASLAADPTMPFDIRLMNGVASTLFVAAALVLAAAALMWLARSPWLAIRVIQVDGELQHNNVATLRANAAPRLAGNLLTIDLQRARAAFEAVPWVRQATLRRVWPDRLAVRLVEHQSAALWLGEDGSERLVNDHGEVFEANLGDIDDTELPRFVGPDGGAAAMLSLYRRLAPLLQPRELRTLRLSGRGSWRAELDNGAIVEMGRGSEDELVARMTTFWGSVAQLTQRFQRGLEYADLRHAGGYAVRLRGITTVLPGTAPNKPR